MWLQWDHHWDIMKGNGLILKGKPSSCKRFVDDIFCLFRSEKEAMELSEYLNTKHPKSSIG